MTGLINSVEIKTVYFVAMFVEIYYFITKKTLDKLESFSRGYVLTSQAASHQVLSALKSLTSVFGMGTGVSSLL